MMSQPISNNLQTKKQGPAGSLCWLSVWQVGFGLVGVFTLWGLALTLIIMVVSSVANASGAMVNELPLLLMAGGFAFAGLLLLPSVGYASLRLMNKPNPFQLKMPPSSTLILVAVMLLGLGFLATKNTTTTWLLLPVIHVLTIGTSILWMISLGIRDLPSGSAQRRWGIFGAGMVAAPFLSLLAEALTILFVVIMGTTYLARDPSFAATLSQISDQHITNPDFSQDIIINTLEPYLMQPIVIYGCFVTAALLVPLIEEFFKPIGVWLLAGRNITPAQGFTAGVLSGAGFALFENLTLSASSEEAWSLVVMARMGTSIVHIVTAGLTGWALTLAWREGRYVQLGATYLISTTIHALWNGLVVISIIPEFLPDLSGFPDAIENIGTFSPIGLIILMIGCFGLLIACNRTLKHAIILPDLVDPSMQTDTFETTEKPIQTKQP